MAWTCSSVEPVSAYRADLLATLDSSSVAGGPEERLAAPEQLDSSATSEFWPGGYIASRDVRPVAHRRDRAVRPPGSHTARSRGRRPSQPARVVSRPRRPRQQDRRPAAAQRVGVPQRRSDRPSSPTAARSVDGTGHHRHRRALRAGADQHRPAGVSTGASTRQQTLMVRPRPGRYRGWRCGSLRSLPRQGSAGESEGCA